MKIVRIELYQVHLPYSGSVYRLSGGREYTGFDSCITRVLTDNGIEGWGESTPFGSTYIAAHALGEAVPEPLLRCVLDCRDMVTLTTADFDAPVVDGGILPPDAPGLGLDVDRGVLGNPAQVWQI
jgi:L-alanine-DL-glutamate epimerase-like enolase superfamily enzyme